MNLKISQRNLKVCLSFGGPKPFLERYTNFDMARGLDSIKLIMGTYLHLRGSYIMTVKVTKVCFIIYY